MIFGREPTAILAFIRAVIYLVVLFGVDITDEQFAGIIVVVETGMAIWNRQKVSPVDNHGVVLPKT